MAGVSQTEALFREHRERLTRFARHLVGAGADADDLVQETFLKAHNYLLGGNEIQSPLSFLFVTMRNLANDAGRQRKLAAVDTAVDTDELSADHDKSSVESQAIFELEFESLCVAIAQLPERMRYAFVLRKVYGYSCREIAQQLGRSTNTVRDQVAQGFKRLQTQRNLGSPDGGENRDLRGHRRKALEEIDDVRPFNLTPLARRESSG